MLLNTVKEYEERVNESLTPVGEASNGYLILTISESGWVYTGYDDFLQRIGCNGHEAIGELNYMKEVGSIKEEAHDIASGVFNWAQYLKNLGVILWV
jgi:hypothetical protein